MTASADTAQHESVIVEAPTVEAALEAVATQLGTDCLILGVEKVSRGGIAGFFGKETFQVQVQRNTAAPAATPVPPTPMPLGSPANPMPGTPSPAPAADEHSSQHQAAVDRVLQVAAQVGDQSAGNQNFGDVLRSELGHGLPGGPATNAIPTNQGPESQGSESQGSAPSSESFDGIDLTVDEAMPQPAVPAAAPTPEPHDPQALDRLRTTVERQRDHAGAGHEVVPITETAPVIASSGAPGAQPAPAPTGPQTAAPTDSPTTARTRPAQGDPVNRGEASGRELGEPLFTADHLVRSGLPFSFVVQLGDLGSVDDGGRLLKLATALQPWCSTLPQDESVVVGLRAERIASAVGHPIIGPTDSVPPAGSVAWATDPNEPAIADYLHQVRGSRRLHLVDPAVSTLAGLEPGTIVSWSEPGAGFDALLFALERGLHLGYDLTGTAPRRATALEMAIAVRERLPLVGS